MRNLVRAFLLTCVSLLFSTHLDAHNVTWWGNRSGLLTNTPMSFMGGQFSQRIKVEPENGEPCWVQVNASTSSGLISADIVTANPGNVVEILVTVLRPPINHLETATVTGSWFATGYPANNNCDGASSFSVPVTVSDIPQMWIANLTMDHQFINLDARVNSALMVASWIEGPWMVMGVGQKFTVPVDMPYQGFVRGFEVGGYVGGQITGNTGAALPSYQISFPFGGDMATSDSFGGYAFPDREPAGTDAFVVTDGLDDGAELDVEVENDDNVTEDWVCDIHVSAPVTNPPPVTNICNCTPWAAIGYGSGAGGMTPVYFSGGANNPKTGTPSCDTPVVTVTSPSGKITTLKAGTNKHQNSGPNPASGTWTVSATVCGKVQTATVDVP